MQYIADAFADKDVPIYKIIRDRGDWYTHTKRKLDFDATGGIKGKMPEVYHLFDTYIFD